MPTFKKLDKDVTYSFLGALIVTLVCGLLWVLWTIHLQTQQISYMDVQLNQINRIVSNLVEIQEEEIQKQLKEQIEIEKSK